MTNEELKAIYLQCRKTIEAQTEEYGLEEIEPRIEAKIEKILIATTLSEARLLASKAESSSQIHCLLLGTKARTPEWFEKQVVKARSLSKSMFNKGEDEEAKRHESRAQRYEIEAKKLREEKHA